MRAGTSTRDRDQFLADRQQTLSRRSVRPRVVKAAKSVAPTFVVFSLFLYPDGFERFFRGENTTRYSTHGFPHRHVEVETTENRPTSTRFSRFIVGSLRHGLGQQLRVAPRRRKAERVRPPRPRTVSTDHAPPANSGLQQFDREDRRAGARHAEDTQGLRTRPEVSVDFGLPDAVGMVRRLVGSDGESDCRTAMKIGEPTETVLAYSIQIGIWLAPRSALNRLFF